MTKSGTRWSADELERFRGNYPHKSNRSLSVEMGRSEVALRTKACKLGIKRCDWRTNKPNLTPSPSLSYIIGVIFGDGYVDKSNKKRTNYNIDLDVNDRDFIDTFNEALYHVIGKRYSIQSHDGRYQVRGQSKFIYFLLKDKNLATLTKFIEPFPLDFIRGFADSEGSICVYNNNGYTSAKIIFCNTNLEVMEYIRQLLIHLGIIITIHSRETDGKIGIKKDGSIIRSHKVLYRMEINRKADISKYASVVNFSIARKQNKLLEFVRNECN